MNTPEKIRCNICDAPKTVTYTEYDAKTGKSSVCTHVVGCVGHEGVLPHLWNKYIGDSTGKMRSLGYDDFQKLYIKIRRQHEKSSGNTAVNNR